MHHKCVVHMQMHMHHKYNEYKKHKMDRVSTGCNLNTHHDKNSQKKKKTQLCASKLFSLKFILGTLTLELWWNLWKNFVQKNYHTMMKCRFDSGTFNFRSPPVGICTSRGDVIVQWEMRRARVCRGLQPWVIGQACMTPRHNYIASRPTVQP